MLIGVLIAIIVWSSSSAAWEALGSRGGALRGGAGAAGASGGAGTISRMHAYVPLMISRMHAYVPLMISRMHACAAQLDGLNWLSLISH